MPRELITIQVGQCGNQIGRRFWDLALAEHAEHNPEGIFDDAMSSFFRNVDARDAGSGRVREIPVGDGTGRISSLRARAVLVDMEEGPVSETLRGPLGELFDRSNLITDISGAGNNWAHGFELYGPQHRDSVAEAVRSAAEMCDSLQSFFVMHSLGGGTGSGVGTYILSMLADDFPDVYRFSTAVFPDAQSDDVITSPYNSVLALAQLSEHADCVLPLDNGALLRMCGGRSTATAAAGDGAEAGSNAFDSMNAIAAQLLTNLTASMRFDGSLNVDLNEIVTNLVPFPRMQFVASGLAPVPSATDGATQAAAMRGRDTGRARSGGRGRGGEAAAVTSRAPGRGLDQLFTDAVLRKEYQLLSLEPRDHTFLACGLLVRGSGVRVSDVNRNIGRLRKLMRIAAWNEDGFKVGLCAVPPAGHRDALLCLANNCGIGVVFSELKGRFDRFYKRKAHLHHYTQYTDESTFNAAAESLTAVIADYASADRQKHETGCDYASAGPDVSVGMGAGAMRSRLVPDF